MPKRHPRRIKLIKPQLQLRLTVVFMAISALSLLLELLLQMNSMSQMALSLPNDGLIVLERLNASLLRVLLVSFLVFLPLTFAVGVLTTFRIAGPVYRFERFLQDILQGEKPADCRLRRGDELQELCDLLNRATAPLRAPTSASAEPSEAESVEPPGPLPSGGAAPRDSSRFPARR